MKWMCLILLFFPAMLWAQPAKPIIQPKQMTVWKSHNQPWNDLRIKEARYQDTTFKVFYVEDIATKWGNITEPIIFVNGKQVGMGYLKALNAKKVAAIEIVKDAAKVSNPEGRPEIHIRTNEPYEVKLISLADIKAKYMPDNSDFVIFMVDEQLVKDDYRLYCLDENNLLSIYVDKIMNPETGLSIPFLRILTKTDKNIKARSEFWIRGMSASNNSAKIIR